MQQPHPPRRVHAALAGQIFDRIAGNEVDQREGEQRHAEESRNDQRSAAEDEAEQASFWAAGQDDPLIASRSRHGAARAIRCPDPRRRAGIAPDAVTKPAQVT